MRVALVVLALLAAAPAQAGVRVVPPFDPADYADRAAVGLLVPGAGPTVTRESALAALLRGKLEHGLLGGIAERREPDRARRAGRAGDPRLAAAARASDNDVRYPIALLGERGLLTSDSTRIDGLVSVTDVAPAASASSPTTIRPGTGDAGRPDRAEPGWRLPLTIALAALLIALAIVRPRMRSRALLVVLAANLWLEPVARDARGDRGRWCCPLGWACAAILAAYLVSMGLDAETVALSPFGPSQSGRFYGINNLLETMLLAPALLGAALLGRARHRSSPGSRSSPSAATASAPTAAASSCSRPRTSCSGCGCAASGRPGGSPGSSRPARSRSRSSSSASTRRPGARATSRTRRRRAGRARGRHRRPDRALRAPHRRELGATAVVLGSLAILVVTRCARRRESGARRRSSSASRSRSSSTTRPATCSGWGRRSRSRLLDTARASTAG